jgi:hypothetical protein
VKKLSCNAAGKSTPHTPEATSAADDRLGADLVGHPRDLARRRLVGRSGEEKCLDAVGVETGDLDADLRLALELVDQERSSAEATAAEPLVAMECNDAPARREELLRLGQRQIGLNRSISRPKKCRIRDGSLRLARSSLACSSSTSAKTRNRNAG